MWCECEYLRVHGWGQGVMVRSRWRRSLFEKTRKRDEDRRVSGVESIWKEMIIRAYGLGASYISCHIDGM